MILRIESQVNFGSQVYLTGSYVIILGCLSVVSFYEGRDNFVLHPKVIPVTSIWVTLHKKVIRYVLEIYFPSFFEQNQNYQQVTWPSYEGIMEFAINSTVKLTQNQVL